MTTATDTFTAADGTTLTTLGGYTSRNGSLDDMEVFNNALVPTNANNNYGIIAERTNESYGTDHSTRILYNANVVGGVGPAVRCAAGNNCVYTFVQESQARVYETLAGVETQLGSTVTHTLADADEYELRAIAAVATLYLNGAPTAATGALTLAAGGPGLWAAGNNSIPDGDWAEAMSATFTDSFGGGSVVGGSVVGGTVVRA